VITIDEERWFDTPGLLESLFAKSARPRTCDQHHEPPPAHWRLPWRSGGTRRHGLSWRPTAPARCAALLGPARRDV